MSILKDIFKVFNGSSWDEHYFKTSSDQVVHTKADGTATTVQEELLEQNSAMGNISGYSKSERKIGTWLNGSPLYEKTIKFTNVGISNGVILQHNIPGINVVYDVSAVFMDGTVCNPFPIVDERGILLQIMANHSILKFVGNVSYSAATSRVIRVTLRYTKD